MGTDDRRDSELLKAAPESSDDWDDVTWAAWWRTAEQAHARPTYAELLAEVAELRQQLATRERQALELDVHNAQLRHDTDDYDELAVPR